MTQPLTTGQMAPDDLILDSHTAAFFDEHHHTGKIERLFHLNYMKLTDFTLGARMAHLRTGEKVAIMQERNADGTPCRDYNGRGPVCFLVEPTAHKMLGTYLTSHRDTLKPQMDMKSQRDAFWHQFDGTNKSRDRSPDLSGYRSSFSTESLWRCHYEENMGVACRLGASGECYLVEINPDRRPPHGQRVDVKENIDLQSLGLPANGSLDEKENTFLRLREQDFHAWMSAKMHDPEEELFQLIRFWGQREEDKCLEVLGCTNAVRQETEAMLRGVLALGVCEGQSLAETGLLEGYTEVSWKPWAWDSLIAWGGGGMRDYISVPDTINQERLDVIAQKGCRLPAFCTEAHNAPGRAKRWVGYKWAVKFEIEVPIAEFSAHDVACMLSA